MLKNFGKILGHKPNLVKASSINHVAIFGYADALENGALFKSVFEVSKRLAEAGYIVVEGGGPGVMRAAGTGAKAAGGYVIGVTLYDKTLTHFEGKDKKNLLDEEIKTKNYLER